MAGKGGEVGSRHEGTEGWRERERGGRGKGEREGEREVERERERRERERERDRTALLSLWLEHHNDSVFAIVT